MPGSFAGQTATAPPCFLERGYLAFKCRWSEKVGGTAPVGVWRPWQGRVTSPGGMKGGTIRWVCGQIFLTETAAPGRAEGPQGARAVLPHEASRRFSPPLAKKKNTGQEPHRLIPSVSTQPVFEQRPPSCILSHVHAGLFFVTGRIWAGHSRPNPAYSRSATSQTAG